jgi:NAD(P)-dependent dehydrogenase (short-subunit alcohol dehydrogenase family)
MKIALVTGGSRGLGRNTALSLARKGVDVILTYRNKPDDARSAVREIEKLGRKAVALQLDAGRIGGFAAFVDEVKSALRKTWDRDRFDFLVNNAGIGVYASFAETTEAQFDELMNVQLKGVSSSRRNCCP